MAGSSMTSKNRLAAVAVSLVMASSDPADSTEGSSTSSRATKASRVPADRRWPATSAAPRIRVAPGGQLRQRRDEHRQCREQSRLAQLSAAKPPGLLGEQRRPAPLLPEALDDADTQD